FSSRRRHTRFSRDWSSDVCSSDLTRGDKVDTYEGDAFTERMVLLEFPDRRKVDAWLNDPEYVAAAEFRKAASVCRILIQEGSSRSEERRVGKAGSTRSVAMTIEEL